MALQLREVTLALDEDESLLRDKIGAYFGVDSTRVGELRILRRGIDARKKANIRRVYTVAFVLPGEAAILKKFAGDQRVDRYDPVRLPDVGRFRKSRRILVVGMGPAGLFAALRLAQQGGEVTLVERGDPVEERVRKVQAFWGRGEFDPRSNVQFGEGGAGTFSDGKLTTRVNSPWNRLVLQTLVECGAPDEILTEAKPHLGTDVLRRMLIGFRQRLQQAGAQIRFGASLTGIECRDGRVVGGIVNDTQNLPTDAVVLAPGHSARDTYAMLATAGVKLEPKPFAVGFRVEHPAELINSIQYGMTGHENLPAADYALRYNDPESGRGVYSFCMCPGGEVITAPSEPDGMVVNGMSFHKRGAAWSNSALVVSVGPADFDGADALSGVRFQQHWERQAFIAGGGDFRAPAENLLGFLGTGSGPVQSTCRPGVREADLSQLLPAGIVAALHRAIPHFDRRLKGFASREAVLVGIESRTSAPLRIVRNEEGESVSHPGLYPCGEGAGYAGGIMSAALDGIRIAELIGKRFGSGVTSEKVVC